MTRDVKSVAPAARALRPRGHRSARGCLSRAALPGGGRQDLPDHHRRSHGRRPDQPRPDGRALAGAGQRCGRHARGLPRPRGRSHGDGRAHAGGGAGCAGLRAPGGRRSHHQHSRRRYRLAVRRFACRRTGWPPAASRARMRRCTQRCAPWAKSCARRSGIAIPVGKDSLSMKTTWREGARRQERRRAGVADRLGVRAAWATCAARSRRCCARLGARPRCGSSIWAPAATGSGASALAQVYGELGDEPADLDDPQRADRISPPRSRSCAPRGMLLAYHDRSDGGLFATLAEMAFAGHCGLDIALPAARGRGARAAVRRRAGRRDAGAGRAMSRALQRRFWRATGFGERRAVPRRARVSELRVQIARRRRRSFDESWVELRRAWSETSWQHATPARRPAVRRRRVRGADGGASDPGLSVALSFDPEAGHRRALHRTRARGRPWRSCASRASTARSRPPRCSSAPASSRTTCT